MAGFVHLHVHSDFSLADASVSVANLADRAEQLGMTHLALTDHGSMFGIMEFIAACEKRKNPVKPIIGCEVYVSPTSRLERKGNENENKYYHLILLAANREGYGNLVRLCSFAYTEGFYYRPRIDEELLASYHGGLIALSACVSGEIPRLIRAGKTAEAEQKALRYRDLFGSDEQGNPNFYLEIQDHGIPADTLKCNLSQRDITRELAAISRTTGIPLVATNDVHYLNREDRVAHDVLICIGTGKTRTEEKRKKYYGDQFYFKSADEMAALFPEYPEAIANTVRIAERCVADIPKITVKDLPGYLPDCDIPAGFATADEYLQHLATEGLAQRYPAEKAEGGEQWRAAQERLEYELGVIIKMGFTGYFLIVADFINWAREHGIPVGPGRGSGAGSIAAYALRITNIDPLKYGLLFERFLNPERVTMPDFDIDFANDGRDDVIRYVTEKYGTDKVAQIITFGTLGAKAVIKDVARVLGISIPESDMISKLIPFRPKITLNEAFEEEPRLRALEADSRFTELFSLARKLEGLNRHSSLHASGVVIGKSELHNFVPMFKDTKTGAIATQYDMNHLEKCGLVKMDFLGLKTLDVIRHTEELIRRRGGKYAGFSVENAPENDKAAFKMLGEGQSFEVFQFESDGMRDVLKRAKPGKIEDLIALNALYRPGPMKFIPQFIDCKNGVQDITYPDPSLEDTLKETYGVIVYQEQVMQVARTIAGFTLGHADELRRAMGKKNMEKMVKEKEQFIAGATERGYSQRKADDIFELLVPFAGYGFNKSHAAAYSVVAYQTAYLKANFPTEFMAANLTNEIHSTNKDKLSECIAEARKIGIAIDPPDINRSDKLFTVADGRIVYGLLGIKGIGDAPAEEIVRCRQDGPYKDFLDFLLKVDIKHVGKSVIEKLIQTGAFDRLGMSRENLHGNLEQAVEYVQKQKDEKKFGQSSLFGEAGEKEYADFVFEEFPTVSKSEWLKTEKQLIGFFLSGHPLDEHRDLWQKAVRFDLGHKETQELGNCILVGIVKAVKIINAKSGKMAYATLEDYNGEIEMVFFPKVWETCDDRVNDDEIAVFKGKVDYQAGKDRFSFIVDKWIDMREAGATIAAEEALHRKREKFRNAWLYMADLKSSGLAAAEKGNYTVVGELASLQTTKDRNGNTMAFGKLRDFEGEIDLVFFAKVWGGIHDLLGEGEYVALKGRLDPDSDLNPQRPSLKVSSVDDLVALSKSAGRKARSGEEPPVPPVNWRSAPMADSSAMPEPIEAESLQASQSAPPLQAIHIRLDGEAAGRDQGIMPLRNYLSRNTGPCPVFIHLSGNGDGSEKIIRAASGLSLEAEKEALGVLEGCVGVAEAWRE
ncbi:MAG: DNA polymerase III subunit alpha [Treponema sp.]|jgi:DNA polymerase-3 subunit alpha|nr:DNA polymerase III subunit alpha [Treponema sp.]